MFSIPPPSRALPSRTAVERGGPQRLLRLPPVLGGGFPSPPHLLARQVKNM